MLVRGAGAGGPSSPELVGRLRWVVLVLLFVFGALIVRLWQLQILRGDSYFQLTVQNVVKERYLPSIRGKILDRHGVPLAENRPAFNIYAVPRTFSPDLASELRHLLGLSDEEMAKVKERIAAGGKRAPKLPVIILEDQPRERAARVEQERFRLPDIEVHHEPYRYYPQGALAAHLVGYMSQMTPEELRRLAGSGYTGDELVGRYGLEAMWENYLRGKKGKERYAVDANGHRLDEATAAGLIEGERQTDPVAGYNLVLTLDVELQKIAERAVAPYPAAAVAVIDVETGRILALVSKPAFDPNVMTGHLTKAEEKFLEDDPRKPFIDKTVRAQYPPGSIYKFVTTLAALEDGVAQEDEKIDCKGSIVRSGTTFHCTAAHGPLDLSQALQHSCNVYFWTLSERVGLDRMAQVANEYGFGARTGLGLNGDSPGRVPTKTWYEQRTRFKIGYTINSATGQGDVEVTVLQMAMAYTALANGGTLFVPQVVDRVVRADGASVISYQPQVQRQIQIPPEHLAILKRGLWRVVNEPGGTAYPYATSDIVSITGKTGTAEVKAKRSKKEIQEIRGWHPSGTHAWFAGWAPSDHPEVAVVVLIEHGGTGGKVAGPVAKQILEGWWTKVRPHNLPPAPPPTLMNRVFGDLLRPITPAIQPPAPPTDDQEPDSEELEESAEPVPPEPEDEP
ncbi:MAG TPA: penicillin-binding protein 2 [Kofleriaceae bacterium]|nr:penicillin-binding protein 2 [Kofleriaceae bacterium]